MLQNEMSPLLRILCVLKLSPFKPFNYAWPEQCSSEMGEGGRSSYTHLLLITETQRGGSSTHPRGLRLLGLALRPMDVRSIQPLRFYPWFDWCERMPREGGGGVQRLSLLANSTLQAEMLHCKAGMDFDLHYVMMASMIVHTGDYRTQLSAKAKAIADALIHKGYDFGFLHVKAVDDTGHDKLPMLKVRLAVRLAF